MNHLWKEFLLAEHATIEHDIVQHFGHYPQELSMSLSKPIMVDLSELGIIHVSGTDAAIFLQGQLTCDVMQLKQPSLGACCDRKGRMLASFWIVQQQQDYFLLLPQSVLPSLLKHFQKYAMFSKVTLQPYAKPHVILGVSQIDLAQQDQVMFIPLHDIFHRHIVIHPLNHAADFWNHLKSKVTPVTTHAWHLLNVASGITLIQNSTQNLFTPQMLNLQLLGGVSFTKGCYIGQEIVARTEHLGQLKRHLYRAQLLTSNLVKPGDEITNDVDEVMGCVVEVAPHQQQGQAILAVIQDRALEQAMTLKINHEILVQKIEEAKHEQTKCH